MKPPTRISVALLLACAAAMRLSASDQVSVIPFTLKTFDGAEHSAELVTLRVPENRRRPTGKTIDLGFLRLRHTGAEAGTVIIFLPPGPGIPGSTLGRVPPFFRLFDRLREFGDVVLLDIRGEGMSSPNLDECSVSPEVSPHALESWKSLVQQFASSVYACADYWRKRGVDLSAYNNEEIADDIDDLRLSLRYRHVSLVGFSAGTDLGIEVLRRHGTTVERAVFAATGAEELRPILPSTYDLQLQKIAALYPGDQPSEDLVRLFDNDVKALDASPVTLQLVASKDKPPGAVKIGSIAFKAVVTEILNGSIGALRPLLTSVRDHDYSLFQIYVQKMMTGFTGSMTLVGRTIDCSAAMPSDRVARVEAEAKTSRLGNYRNIHLQPAVCRAALGEVPRYSRPEPLFSTTPTLFISGGLDANTPPADAETLRWGFVNATHVVIRNGFHDTLPSPDVQRLILDFFKGDDVIGRTIKFDLPRSLPLEEAILAAQRSR